MPVGKRRVECSKHFQKLGFVEMIRVTDENQIIGDGFGDVLGVVLF